MIWLDIIIAIIVVIFFLCYPASTKLDRQLFWLGCRLGALWEFPLYFIGPEFSDTPPYRLLVAFPVHPILQPISHSFWDGALFMIGIYLIRQMLPNNPFLPFNWKALGVYVLWGIGSALTLEIIGSMGIWEYIPNQWNVVLFQVKGKNITSLAPLTWTIAPIIHYSIAGYLVQRRSKLKVVKGEATSKHSGL